MISNRCHSLTHGQRMTISRSGGFDVVMLRAFRLADKTNLRNRGELETWVLLQLHIFRLNMNCSREDRSPDVQPNLAGETQQPAKIHLSLLVDRLHIRGLMVDRFQQELRELLRLIDHKQGRVTQRARQSKAEQSVGPALSRPFNLSGLGMNRYVITALRSLKRYLTYPSVSDIVCMT